MIELIWDSLEWLPDVLETLLKNHDVPPVIARLIAWIIPIISTVMIIRKQLKKKGSLEDIQEIKAMLRYQIEREGGTWDADLNSFNNATTKPLSNYSPRSLVHTVGSIMKKMAIPVWGSRLRRKTKMKEYLKKLGRTKFQAFLLMTVTNIVTMVLVLNGTVDLDGALEQWGPFLNLGVQFLVSAVYIFVEGGIDKANVKSAQAEIAATDEPKHPLDTH